MLIPEEGMGEHSCDICGLYLENFGIGVEVNGADIDILHGELLGVFFVL
jgi:hypothetical protein